MLLGLGAVLLGLGAVLLHSLTLRVNFQLNFPLKKEETGKLGGNGGKWGKGEFGGNGGKWGKHGGRGWRKYFIDLEGGPNLAH